jgi:hypothetical protein
LIDVKLRRMLPGWVRFGLLGEIGEQSGECSGIEAFTSGPGDRDAVVGLHRRHHHLSNMDEFWIAVATVCLVDGQFN